MVACAAAKEAVYYMLSIFGFADETTKKLVQGASLDEWLDGKQLL